jgi:hypothetical protein
MRTSLGRGGTGPDTPQDSDEQAEGADVNGGAPQADCVYTEQLGPDQIDHHHHARCGTSHTQRVQAAVPPRWWEDQQGHRDEVDQAENRDQVLVVTFAQLIVAFSGQASAVLPL